MTDHQRSVNDPLTSSLSMLDKKFIMTLCFLGYFWHRALMACTTTTWSETSIRDRFRTTEYQAQITGFEKSSEAVNLMLEINVLWPDAEIQGDLKKNTSS